MPALTVTEATARAALVDVESYDLFLDLTTEPVASRTEVRFRCRQPGAETFADLDMPTVRSAILNGNPLPPPAGGRLSLSGLAADNVLTVEAEVSDAALSRFTDPADGGTYLHGSGFPATASELMTCFDQPDLGAAVTVSMRAPAGWECFASGAVEQRPAPGAAGVWRFAPVPGLEPYILLICAGPFATEEQGTAGAVRMSVSRRGSLASADGVAALAQFGDTARQALERYERSLGVPCPDQKYDILFVPGLAAVAVSVPGLMLVTESLLARMTDPDDDVTAMVCAHEVAHLWFGSYVSMHWWDDLWLDEAMATYLSQTADARQWTAFGYRSKADAYQADELPGREPVSSPVASSAQALSRPSALTYSKGASVIRQLAALIGDDALNAGLTDYLTRFGGSTATLNDLVGCWSRASGRELAGWAEEWLRTAGASTLRPELTVAGNVIASLTVVQDMPRTHRIGIGLYDLDGDARLRRRRLVHAEVSGERTPVPALAGEAAPDAVMLNDGDLSYARITFDERSFRTLSTAAMNVGDPLTEAVCWNTVWHMVTSGELAAADLVALILRRVGTDGAGTTEGTLPLAGVEKLIERAVACADTWSPAAERARLREQTATAVLAAADEAAPGSQLRRVLTAAFATSAHSPEQLDLLASWLRGQSRPAGLTIDAGLRAQIMFTLAACGLARDADIDSLAELDPVGGEMNRATCRAMRPDPAAKADAWRAALSGDIDWQLAEAHARGIWVPGQEALMAAYRDRYFAEALPALGRLGTRAQRRLGRLLFPSTLIDAATIAAAAAAAAAVAAARTGEVKSRENAISDTLRVAVAEQAAIMRSALHARTRDRTQAAS